MIKRNIIKPLLCIALVSQLSMAWAHDKHKTSWGTPPSGMETIGETHGEIAVANNGDIYTSVVSGKKPGIQVYSPAGEYLRNIDNAPTDFHGFTIHKEGDQEFIYGSGNKSQKIFKMTLSGDVVLEVDVFKAIKNQLVKYQQQGIQKTLLRGKKLKLSAVDVSSNGDIYVIDGYGADFIHRFDKSGNYLSSFGGRESPYAFSNAHKLAIDKRFSPERILLTDRKNLRLVHLTLDGTLIGDVNTKLKRPSAIAFYNDYVGVAEIGGAVSVLDKQGNIVNVLGGGQIKRPKSVKKPFDLPIEHWLAGRVNTPHGIAFDKHGDIFITEFNKYGRLLKFESPLSQDK
ncbi:hypothetical protein [Thalassotalea crassostreae]|uniref:hypothetical protein n=1 Tax=Thalassotalea crassostreae TaxID=1763536 RepID=UPI000837C169|nr:hypothetical protein [Thalassotalea crassostreae]